MTAQGSSWLPTSVWLRGHHSQGRTDEIFWEKPICFWCQETFLSAPAARRPQATTGCLTSMSSERGIAEINYDPAI